MNVSSFEQGVYIADEFMHCKPSETPKLVSLPPNLTLMLISNSLQPHVLCTDEFLHHTELEHQSGETSLPGLTLFPVFHYGFPFHVIITIGIPLLPFLNPFFHTLL